MVRMTQDVINMSLLFESFLVFYMLECVVLVSLAVWFYYTPKEKTKKIYNPWGFWEK